MSMFEDNQPDELLALLKNFKTAIDGTVMTSSLGQINCLCTILYGEAVRAFYELAIHNSGTKFSHLKHITEVLLRYFIVINAISKQRGAMYHAMRKPRIISFKYFDSQLTEIKNYFSLLPELSEHKKMDLEKLNEILLHAIHNGWAKKSYLQRWDLEGKTYKETCKMFDQIEIAEQFYKGLTPYKTAIR